MLWPPGMMDEITFVLSQPAVPLMSVTEISLHRVRYVYAVLRARGTDGDLRR